VSSWTLETRNGKLYACEHSTDYYEPRIVHAFHLVQDKPAQWVLERVGEPLSYEHGFWYLSMMASPMMIRPLAVYSEFCEFEPLKAPGRGGKAWRWEWYLGEWRKRSV